MVARLSPTVPIKVNALTSVYYNTVKNLKRKRNTKKRFVCVIPLFYQDILNGVLDVVGQQAVRGKKQTVCRTTQNRGRELHPDSGWDRIPEALPTVSVKEHEVSILIMACSCHLCQKVK